MAIWFPYQLDNTYQFLTVGVASVKLGTRTKPVPKPHTLTPIYINFSLPVVVGNDWTVEATQRVAFDPVPLRGADKDTRYSVTINIVWAW